MAAKYRIGIDIGGTNTDIGLVLNNGTIAERSRLSTSQYSEPERYLEDLSACISGMMTRQGVDHIDGIGVGAPNIDHATGCIFKAANINMNGTIDFRNGLGKRLHVPVAAGNDANAAAVGEMVYGKAKGMKHFVMLTLGTGVGSGIIVDGHLLLGATGYAGEIGHCIVEPHGRLCSCKRHGCLEEYASARGIVATYINLRKQATASLLADIPDNEITCKMIGKAALEGDKVAVETYRVTADYLALALANTAAAFNPEAIFLMGGPTREGDLLLNPLREQFDKYLLYILRGSCTIDLSGLPDNDAAILGAASLCEILL